MSSKQEKLAAARRKLKEFQGKYKEPEIIKQKIPNDSITPNITKNSSNEVTNPPIVDRENIQSSPITSEQFHTIQSVINQTTDGSVSERKISDSSLNGSNPSRIWPEYHNPIFSDSLDLPGGKSDCSNGLTSGCIESHDVEDKNNLGVKSFSNILTRDGSGIASVKNQENNEAFFVNDGMKLQPTEAKQFFNYNADNKSLNDVIRPLQMELQNHAQTIAILVQQRNDAQTALTEAQSVLDQKSGEIQELKQQITNLTSSGKNISQRLEDAESVIMKLKLEKEDNMQKQDEIKSLADKLQSQLDEKEEEVEELKRKLEEKSRECQRLLFSLQEAQSQLSLYQIQLQQYSAEGHSGLAAQFSQFQSENLSLKQKILELEKKLEAENVEKEEASQKFHIYAQQCNSQLSSLNSQLNSLKSENENLSQENKILTENLAELEEKKKEPSFSTESFESEIANLHNQLSALSGENENLKCNLKKKDEECSDLVKALDERELEVNKLLSELRELEEENKTLANEAETPKANERLLATMESDKIAASKAVSQNQKLKEQVLELETAFMKISEEKLELTNQLAHEKHVSSELQNLLKNAESKHEDHHHHDHDCHHEDKESEALVNDSNEIGELRNIVRQLQDDKMELTARLNSYEGKKGSLNEERGVKEEDNCQHEHDHEEVQCENTKLLLQQMEEKVKKTMNEIAVLDEEKEKLEHLVLQLQEETETIGEYITLYQKQRMLLRQRAQEKDIQLLQLSRDKEELKSKLVSLDDLVQRLIAERENVTTQPVSNSSGLNSSPVAADNTAGKIRALINEIGSTTLINNQAIAFEHCSCCSGRLITI